MPQRETLLIAVSVWCTLSVAANARGKCSSEEEGSDKKGRMPTGDIKKMLHYWEEFQSLATKWHPNKAEMNRLCALVEDKCLNHFKKRNSINFGQIFDFSFNKETEASY